MHLDCELREIRQRQGKSLSDISAVCGLNRGTLSMIERGLMLPTDAQVPGLEKAYGVEIETVYTRKALLALREDAPKWVRRAA